MTIGQFLLRLACDPQYLNQFAEDAETAMRDAGLDERQVQFLLSADLSELRVKVEAELIVDGEKLSIGTVCVPTICAPNPPPSPSEPQPDS